MCAKFYAITIDWYLQRIIFFWWLYEFLHFPVLWTRLLHVTKYWSCSLSYKELSRYNVIDHSLMLSYQIFPRLVQYYYWKRGSIRKWLTCLVFWREFIWIQLYWNEHMKHRNDGGGTRWFEFGTDSRMNHNSSSIYLLLNDSWLIISKSKGRDYLLLEMINVSIAVSFWRRLFNCRISR